MVKRILENKIIYNASKYPVVAIVGPRQSGKTTLVTHCFPHYPYVSLEDPDSREYAIEDPRGLLSEYSQGAIIDEIQRVPDLLSYIQTIVDKDKRKGQFILTGSNQFMLMKKISQSLAGRISILKLLPFSWKELQTSRYSLVTLDQYLFTGSYPRIYDEELESKEWHRNYIETYCEKDLKEIVRINDLAVFRKMLSLLASSVGQLLNLSALGNSIGVSHNTIKSWIYALEESYLLFILQPYYRNMKKRLVKTPKIYFYDTGLLTTLLRIRKIDELKNHYARGQIFENMVIIEHIKHKFNLGEFADFYFWRDHIGNEIDLIADEGTFLHIAEIKSANTIRSDFFKNLNYFKKISPFPVSTSSIIYGGEIKQQRSGSSIIPWKELSVYLDNL